MKKLTVWLNEDEYKRFLARAFSRHQSPYALLKEIVLRELSGT
jgi:hypothetical protein